MNRIASPLGFARADLGGLVVGFEEGRVESAAAVAEVRR